MKIEINQLSLDFSPIKHGEFYRAQVCYNHDGKSYAVVAERLTEQAGQTFRTHVEFNFNKFKSMDKNRMAAFKYLSQMEF